MEYLHFLSSHVFPLEEISSNQQEGCVLLGPMDEVASVSVPGVPRMCSKSLPDGELQYVCLACFCPSIQMMNSDCNHYV
jgi:hypothetical protein